MVGGSMRTRSIAWITVALLCSVPLVVAAQDLPRAKPETVGLSSERLVRISRWLAGEIEQNKVPGAVVLVARHGKIAYFEALGKRDPATGGAMTMPPRRRRSRRVHRVGGHPAVEQRQGRHARHLVLRDQPVASGGKASSATPGRYHPVGGLQRLLP